MIILCEKGLKLDGFIKVAKFNEKIAICSKLKEKIVNANNSIKKILEKEKKVYGVNTGFGKLSDIVIENSNLYKLQENLLKSHACGVGENFKPEIVRGMMALRVNALARGFSGIRFEVVAKLIEFLNNDIIPVVPSQGSLGASGDLAPLAHMSLPLIGLGEVYYNNKIMKTKDALALAGVEALSHLEAKEGLSLINGTQAMTSVGALALYDSFRLLKYADLALSLSLEALRGIECSFDERLHLARGQVGQIKAAKNIRNLTLNSEYITKQGEVRTQDAYSLRCAAQVHGASWDAFNYVLEKVEIEMNAATDNPLVFNGEDVISGGNFHGQVMAQAFDFLKIAVSEVANISERRIERLVNPTLNEGLPAFLVAHPGINSGFMIIQYSAASLVSENKVLAHPASVDSIPSSANQEDHVSMGTIAARGASEIINNAYRVVAMEILAAVQGIDFREKKNLGKATQIAYEYIRKEIPFIDEDLVMYPIINKTHDLIRYGNLLEKIEAVIGSLYE